MSSDSRDEELYRRILDEEQGPVVRPPGDGKKDEEVRRARTELHLMTSVLFKYRNLFFSPSVEDEPEDIDAEVRRLMEETKPLRREQRRIVAFRRFAVVALPVAATVLIALGLLWHFGVPGPAPRPLPGMRVAYLTDVAEKVEVLRGGQRVSTGLSGYVLETADIVTLGKAGQATVVFPDGVYPVNGGSRVLVTESGLWDQQARKEQRPRLSTSGRRDSEFSLSEARLAMAVPALLAPVSVPTLRAGEPEVLVLTPSGRTLSTTPDLVWTGDKDALRDVALARVGPSRDLGQEIGRVKGAKEGRMTWQQAGRPLLERGKKYVVLVRAEDGTLLSGAQQTFELMSDAEASELEKRLAIVDKALPDGQARQFIKANLLMNDRWQCFSEARLEAVELVKQEPECIPYLKLLQHCYKALNLPGGVKQVQEELDKVSGGSTTGPAQ